jgi:hypothetical protein
MRKIGDIGSHNEALIHVARSLIVPETRYFKPQSDTLRLADPKRVDTTPTFIYGAVSRATGYQALL